MQLQCRASADVSWPPISFWKHCWLLVVVVNVLGYNFDNYFLPEKARVLFAFDWGNLVAFKITKVASFSLLFVMSYATS